MTKKINIFSNFNVNNISKIFYNEKKFRVKEYSNQLNLSLKIEKLMNLKSDFNIFILDYNFFNIELTERLLRFLKKNNNKNIIIFIDYARKNIFLPIMREGYSLDLMNKKVKTIKKFSNCFIFDFNELVKNFNNIVFNDKKFFLSKNPFTNNFENFLCQQIYYLIDVINGNRKKAIFVDLDDTIWGGTLAEDGYKKLKIGGIDAEGEIFKKIQELLLEYQKTGMLLGIISRNNEQSAIYAINKHKEMILKMEHFVGWRINYKRKSENILSLCKEMNILPESVVFFDNSAFEREEVANSIPEIFVPDLGDDPSRYPRIIENIKNMSFIKLNKEDIKRNDNYLSFNKFEKKYKSKDKLLRSLKMELKIENFNSNNLDRIHQMFNKINQLNLTSRRLDQKEIMRDSKTITFKTFRLKDKLTDLGIISLIGYKKIKNNFLITDFLFSCRALGRDLEKYIIESTINNLILNKNSKVKIKIKKTKKNQLCFDLLKEIFQSKFKNNEVMISKKIKESLKKEIFFKI